MKLTGHAKRINRSFQHNLCEKARFGESKHAAKQAARQAYLIENGTLRGWNPAKVEGIYSIRTMETYRASMERFAKWASEQGVKNIKGITPELASQYLLEREAAGLSMWTVSMEMAAINKTLDYELTKRSVGLSERRREDVWRSRGECHNRAFKAYQDHILLARACGCRRASITRVTPKDFVRNQNGVIVGVRLCEKGGKQRVAPVLNQYKQPLMDMVNRRMEAESGLSAEKPLFDRYDLHIKNHAYRAEYARNLLEQLTSEKTQGKAWFGGDLRKEEYIHLSKRDAERTDAYGYSIDVAAAVSGALGHNRLDVLGSYLW